METQWLYTLTNRVDECWLSSDNSYGIYVVISCEGPHSNLFKHTPIMFMYATLVCVCVCILKSVGRMLYYYSRWDPVLIIILYFSGITASSTWCNVTGRSEWESLPVESLNNQKVQCLQVFNADLLLQFFKRKKIRAPGQRDRETGRQTIATAADWRVSGSCSHWWPTAYFMEGSRIYNKRKKKHPL